MKYILGVPCLTTEETAAELGLAVATLRHRERNAPDTLPGSVRFGHSRWYPVEGVRKFKDELLTQLKAAAGAA